MFRRRDGPNGPTSPRPADWYVVSGLVLGLLFGGLVGATIGGSVGFVVGDIVGGAAGAGLGVLVKKMTNRSGSPN